MPVKDTEKTEVSLFEQLDSDYDWPSVLKHTELVHFIQSWTADLLKICGKEAYFQLF